MSGVIGVSAGITDFEISGNRSEVFCAINALGTEDRLYLIFSTVIISPGLIPFLETIFKDESSRYFRSDSFMSRLPHITSALRSFSTITVNSRGSSAE
ncbi:hypothetical protein D3C78_1755560 [compost metagenome]